MSLTLKDDAVTLPKVVLRTADQYTLWKERVAACCWAATRLDVFTLTDAQCEEMAGESDEKKSDKERQDKIGKCFIIITSLLSDEIFVKVAHIEKGKLASLIAEIRATLAVNSVEDINPLRVELYSASMARDCQNDLQTYISYIISRKDKLAFLKSEVPESEIIHIFLKGLSPVFHPIQVHFAIPGTMPKDFKQVVAIVRRFSNNPLVAADLAKAKTASHVTLIAHSSNHTNLARESICRLFAQNGVCRFGSNCKFSHGSLTSNVSSSPTQQAKSKGPTTCFYCKKKGHVSAVCRKRLYDSQKSGEGKQQHTVSLMSDNLAAAPQIEATSDHEDSDDAPIILVLTAQFSEKLLATSRMAPTTNWICDSGATSNATYDEKECVDVHPCSVQVTAAGTTFEVTKRGTAIVQALDTKGKAHELRLTGCLISDKFPFKLLALQSFTNKGHTVVFKDRRMQVSNPRSNITLFAIQDDNSQLFVLQCAQKTENPKNHCDFVNEKDCPRKGDADFDEKTALLARSYTASDDNADLWSLHLRHGHRNFADLCRQYGIPAPKNLPVCTSCVMGKAHTFPPDSPGFRRATRPAEGLHTDFRGPYPVAAHDGSMYLLLIVDDYSRRLFGFLCRSQTEWYSIFPKFVTRVEAELGKANCIAWLMSDNGGVYCAQHMEEYYASKGIQHVLSAPYSQWQNHTAERSMRTVGEMALTTAIHANLPKMCWGWATLQAIEVLNRTSESRTINDAAGAKPTSTRLEKWKGVTLPTQTRCLKPLGCLTLKHIPGAVRTKLDPHAIKMVYLGLDSASRAFLLGTLYDLTTTVSAEVTFVENVFPFRLTESNYRDTVMQTDMPKASYSATGVAAPPTPIPAPMEARTRMGLKDHFLPPSISNNNSGDVDTSPQVVEIGGFTKPQEVWRQALEGKTPTAPDTTPTDGISVHTAPLRRSARIANQVTRQSSVSDDNATISVDASTLVVLTEATLDSFTPRTAQAAISSEEKTRWTVAMQREKDCHVKNRTFGDCISTLPAGEKAIPTDWVFKLKHRGGPVDSKDLTDKQFKARVVIRGQFMREGIDFNDTWAPVVKPATLRAVLAIAAKYKCLLYAGDIETAFLTADMDCIVYVRMPPYWGEGDGPIDTAKSTTNIRILLKGVPGIPQGSRLFWQTFSEFLLSIGYTPSSADRCLFINQKLSERNGCIIYVDDFLYFCETEKTKNVFIGLVRGRFTVPTFLPLTVFLGMVITREVDKHLIQISQANTVRVLLERANMTSCNPSPSPAATGTTFTKSDCPSDEAANTTTSEFRSLVALINFIACWTRPDITFVVNRLCKYMSNPGLVHWKILKHLIRYLRGTQEYGLTLDMSDSNGTLVGYSDSSFGDCIDTGRSTLAYTFLYHGAVLSWYSKLNTFVTLSTNHAEYAALALAGKEAEWLVLLFQNLDPKVPCTPVPILVDNSGVVSLVHNPVDHKTNKHIKLSCHYSRELTEQKVIFPRRIASEDNLADLFTKVLPIPTFKRLAAHLVQPCPERRTEAMLMMFSQPDPDSDDTASLPGAEWEVPTGPEPSSDFQSKWPYLSTMKGYLNASSCEVRDTGTTYSSGRPKLIASFYRFDTITGTKHLISTHDAMTLTSRSHKQYTVCSITPHQDLLPTDPAPQPVVSSSSAQFAGVATPADHNTSSCTTSVIRVIPQTPLLVCAGCLTHNHQMHSYIACARCHGREFQWSCACCTPANLEAKHAPPAPPQPTSTTTSTVKESTPSTPQPQDLNPITQVANPPTPAPAPARPRRNIAAQKHWSPQIKYETPLRRAMLYHHVDCEAPEGPTAQASVEFANAFAMKRAPCCLVLWNAKPA